MPFKTLVGLLYLGYFIAPFGSPAIGISRLILALSWLYFFNYLLSVKAKLIHKSKPIPINGRRHLICDVISLLVCGIIIFVPSKINGLNALFLDNFWKNVLSSLLIFCLAELVRSIDFLNHYNKEPENEALNSANRIHSMIAIVGFVLFVLLFSVFQTAIEDPKTLLTLGFFLGLSLIVAKLFPETTILLINKLRKLVLGIKESLGDPDSIAVSEGIPKPKFLFGFEAIIVLLIGLQLINPWVRNYQLIFETEEETQNTWSESICNKSTNVTHDALVINRPSSLSCMKRDVFAKQGADIFSPSYIIDSSSDMFAKQIIESVREGEYSFIGPDSSQETEWINFLGEVHRSLVVNKTTTSNTDSKLIYYNNEEFRTKLSKALSKTLEYNKQNLILKELKIVEEALNKKERSFEDKADKVLKLIYFVDLITGETSKNNTKSEKEYRKRFYNDISSDIQGVSEQITNLKQGVKHIEAIVPALLEYQYQNKAQNKFHLIKQNKFYKNALLYIQKDLRLLEEQLKENNTTNFKYIQHKHHDLLYRIIIDHSKKATSEERYWIISLIILLMLIRYVEHEWIVKTAGKLKSSLLFSPGKRLVRDNSPFMNSSELQTYTRYTFFYWFYKEWLPVLEIQVNLGFDHLEYKKVVEAMLTGLRDGYHAAFLSWKSVFANFIRFIRGLILLISTVLLGNVIFEVDQGNIELKRSSIAEFLDEYYERNPTLPVTDKYAINTQLDLNNLSYISVSELTREYDEIIGVFKNEKSIKELRNKVRNIVNVSFRCVCTTYSS